MSIEIKKIDSVKKVDKPWGYEKWIADGAPNFKYALKEIFFKSGFKSSIQFHEFKEETSYVKSGTGILHYYPERIDFDRYKNGDYNDEDIQEIIDNLQHDELESGMVYHIKPGIIHRVEALTDLTLIESSTIELDDVTRINDQWGRNNGTVSKEHKRFPIRSHFFVSQTSRIEFSREFVKDIKKEKILFSSYGINTQYAIAKELLDAGCNEVWHNNNSGNKLCIRKLNSENKVEVKEGLAMEEIKENSFDVIFSFEEIQFQQDLSLYFTKYKKILKENGVLVISSFNKDSSTLDITEEVGYSREELLKLIKPEFSKIEEFSQGLILHDTDKLGVLDSIKSKLKTGTRTILNNVDQKQNFYKLYLQPSILKQREKRLAAKRIDFKPIHLEEDQNSLYYLFICKK